MPLHTLALPDPPPAQDTPPEQDTPPPPRPLGALGAEGVLQNALVQLREQARAKRVDMNRDPEPTPSLAEPDSELTNGKSTP